MNRSLCRPRPGYGWSRTGADCRKKNHRLAAPVGEPVVDAVVAVIGGRIGGGTSGGYVLALLAAGWSRAGTWAGASGS